MRLWAACQRFVSQKKTQVGSRLSECSSFFQLNNRNQDSAAAPARICLKQNCLRVKPFVVFICFTSRQCQARCVLLIVCYRWNSLERMASQNSTFLSPLLTYFSEYQERGVNSVCWMWENLKETFEQSSATQSPIEKNEKRFRTLSKTPTVVTSQYDVIRVQNL